MNLLIEKLAEKCFYTETTYENGFDESYKAFNSKLFAKIIIEQCGYYADVFDALGCDVNMNPADTRPSDYIKQKFESYNV